jgi:hypothetical protein
LNACGPRLSGALQGREREFLTWLFRAKSTRPWTITPADLDAYVRVNAAPGATRAALSYYRHKLGPEGLAHSQARAERKLAMPVLAFGAARIEASHFRYRASQDARDRSALLA